MGWRVAPSLYGVERPRMIDWVGCQLSSFGGGCGYSKSIQCSTYLMYCWSARSRDREIARIQVCQNKHCKRNFVYLPQGTITLPEILQDLLSCSAPDGSGGDHSVEVVTTGCLSQCDRGPNIEITTRSNDGRGSEQQSYLCHGIQDHFQAAAELEMLGFPVLPQIIATYSVFVKAQKGIFKRCSNMYWFCVRAEGGNGCILRVAKRNTKKPWSLWCYL